MVMPGVSFSTMDTVDCEQAARLATSVIVTRRFGVIRT